MSKSYCFSRCKKHLGFGIVPPEDLLHKSCPEKEGEGIWNLNQSGPTSGHALYPRVLEATHAQVKQQGYQLRLLTKEFVVFIMAYRQKSIRLGCEVLTHCYANRCGESFDMMADGRDNKCSFCPCCHWCWVCRPLPLINMKYHQCMGPKRTFYTFYRWYLILRGKDCWCQFRFGGFLFTPGAGSETREKIPPVVEDVLHTYVASWLNTGWGWCRRVTGFLIELCGCTVDGQGFFSFNSHPSSTPCWQRCCLVPAKGSSWWDWETTPFQGRKQSSEFYQTFEKAGVHAQRSHHLAAFSSSDQLMASSVFSVYIELFPCSQL